MNRSAPIPFHYLARGPSADHMKLSFNNVAKRFGDLHVIEEFTREIASGELVALVGPSGCGKSTLLHMAAGLEKPSSGTGRRRPGHPRPASRAHPDVPGKRALPWLTLQQNVALALEFQNVDKKKAAEQARVWLDNVKLKGFENYYPHQVSGGMRQRAALARAFISQAQGAAAGRTLRRARCAHPHDPAGCPARPDPPAGPTVVLVTHDVDEALFLADRIFVFSPRPAKVLKEFNLVHHEKTHDLSEFAATRREILCLLGIHAEQDEFAKTWKGLEYETRTHPGTGHRRRCPGFHRQCLCPGKIQDRLPARHGRCPAMAAYEAGLYKKYGLDVELIEFKSGTDLVKAIVGGQLDSGVFGFSNAVAWASKGPT
jgi:NitT/TauT family transport system ATP-binding protein